MAVLDGKKIKNRTQSIMNRQTILPRYHLSSHARVYDSYKFSNFSLYKRIDTFQDTNRTNALYPVPTRAKIVEIVSSAELVFCLTQSGICIAYERNSLREIGSLNHDYDDVIRSLFLNRKNQSLITVSVTQADNFTSLKCRSTPLSAFLEGKEKSGTSIFESESLKWPGFVEFDDVNGKVLTYSVDNDEKLFKIWSLKDYKLLYCLEEEDVEEIKISCGVMLLIHRKKKALTYKYLPLKLIDIETGEELVSFKHLLKLKRKLDFIEQFNEKLLIKQEGENLHIYDVSTGELVEVPCSDFVTPSAFIFLYENSLFLTFRERSVVAWNFKGEAVTKFEDHELMYSDCNTNNIYITGAQDIIISYCKDGDLSSGSINISNIFSGKCIGKISASSSCLWNDEYKALEDVTAIYYNEELNEFYTGTDDGHLHSWRN